MRRWEKALLAVDRVLGTGEPPSRLEFAAARHPVRVGVTSGTVMAVLIAAALSGFDNPVVLFQAALTGAGVGLLGWAACRKCSMAACPLREDGQIRGGAAEGATGKASLAARGDSADARRVGGHIRDVLADSSP